MAGIPGSWLEVCRRVVGAGLLALFLMASPSAAPAQTLDPANPAHAKWPGRGQLFVGANYQPVDRSPAEIRQDIAIMKAAGFNIVRMGDLSWDAFEPAEDRFEFAWFDSVMDQMHAAGIKVVLDIPGMPAPIWLHKKYPGVDLVNQEGDRVPPAERYMDNISDPDYRRRAIVMAEAITKRYAKHPAVISLGYNNEIGNGFMSYSEADRRRFIVWLKAKYGTVEKLNAAWATQRWSRHLNSFDEVDLPLKDGPGPAERYLDLHRYWSDVSVDVLLDLEAVRKKHMPNTPVLSNLWDTSGRKGFDYLGTYKKYTTYGARGFYPGDPLSAAVGSLMIKGDLDTPVWYNEFTAGGPGYYGTKGRSRMWAYFGLLFYNQATIAWTFNSHRGGEEQALFGLVDHDGSPSWKVDEFKQIATEFRKLEKLGFPRYDKPQVALNYSFDSFIASKPNGPSNSTRDYFKTPYDVQVDNSYQPFMEDNIDAAVIDIAHAKLDDYKLLVVAAKYVMDEASANAIRNYVRGGGTVIMTAYSAKVDETGLWFNTPLPGRLSDVFGVKTRAFYRGGATSGPDFVLNGAPGKTTDGFFEILEPTTAKALGHFTNTEEKSPIATVNTYGKGQAIYLATTPQPSTLGPLVRGLYPSLGIRRGPETPAGVLAREVQGRTLYVNMTGTEKDVPIKGRKTGVITGRTYDGVLKLGGMQADLLE